jgi:uncharacterized protein
VRAVLDTNVIVSAVLAANGSPARVLRAWIEGAFELITSPNLLDELRRVLDFPKLAAYIDRDDARQLCDLIAAGSAVVEDPIEPARVRSVDPEDDYLIALAAATRSLLVTGDADLLVLADRIPVMTPAEFLARL